jgi:hypothetical protein
VDIESAAQPITGKLLLTGFPIAAMTGLGKGNRRNWPFFDSSPGATDYLGQYHPIAASRFLHVADLALLPVQLMPLETRWNGVGRCTRLPQAGVLFVALHSLWAVVERPR